MPVVSFGERDLAVELDSVLELEKKKHCSEIFNLPISVEEYSPSALMVPREIFREQIVRVRLVDKVGLG